MAKPGFSLRNSDCVILKQLAGFSSKPADPTSTAQLVRINPSVLDSSVTFSVHLISKIVGATFISTNKTPLSEDIHIFGRALADWLKTEYDEFGLVDFRFIEDDGPTSLVPAAQLPKDHSSYNEKDYSTKIPVTKIDSYLRLSTKNSNDKRKANFRPPTQYVGSLLDPPKLIQSDTKPYQIPAAELISAINITSVFVDPDRNSELNSLKFFFKNNKMYLLGCTNWCLALWEFPFDVPGDRSPICIDKDTARLMSLFRNSATINIMFTEKMIEFRSDPFFVQAIRFEHKVPDVFQIIHKKSDPMPPSVSVKVSDFIEGLSFIKDGESTTHFIIDESGIYIGVETEEYTHARKVAINTHTLKQKVRIAMNAKILYDFIRQFPKADMMTIYLFESKIEIMFLEIPEIRIAIALQLTEEISSELKNILEKLRDVQ